METTSKKIHPSHPTESTVKQDEFRHLVQFCESDEFLIEVISNFIRGGLRNGDACIVIATKPHRESLEEQLKQSGLEVETFRDQGLYISIDASSTLSQFMVNGSLDPDLFTQIIGNLIIQSANRQHNVRIFGELVALLWAEGKREAAISLEELWNDLSKNHPFSLLCAYPMQGFSGEMYEMEFNEICKQHTRVIPAESYTTLNSPDERLLTIALMQQKANSLEVEIAKHKLAAEQLQVSESNYRRLFDSNLIGVFISDFAGTFLDANNAFLNLLGYTRKELQSGKMHRDDITPSELHHLSQIAVKAMQETGVSSTYEKEYLHKSGRRIPVLVAVTRIDQTDLCVGFVLDISERKELEKRKDEFISMASH